MAAQAHILSIGKRKETRMTILSDLIDALAAVAIVGAVICFAIALNP